jgi:cytochrome c oxidase subunit 2
MGCSGSHEEANHAIAPNLAGVYGSNVKLSDGRTVRADEAYLRDSMLKPRQDVAAGFEPIMPSYAGILTDGEIISLTAYIRSLSGKEENRQ